MRLVERATKTGQMLTVDLTEDSDGRPLLRCDLDGKTIGTADGVVSISPGKGIWKNAPAEASHAIRCSNGQIVVLKSTEGMACRDAMLSAQTAYWEAKEARLEAMFPGLKELSEAREAEEEYAHQFEHMMEDERNDGVRPPVRPAGPSADELAVKFPRAALYLRAKSYQCAANHHKSSAGTAARELLEGGGSEDEARAILKNWLPAERMWD